MALATYITRRSRNVGQNVYAHKFYLLASDLNYTAENVVIRWGMLKIKLNTPKNVKERYTYATPYSYFGAVEALNSNWMQ